MRIKRGSYNVTTVSTDVTNMHGTPLAIAGSISLEGEKVYVTVNLIALS